MTHDEIRALDELMARTRDEFRQVAEWLRGQELDRGIQRLPVMVLRLSAQADEMLMMTQRYARKAGLDGEPLWKSRGFASPEEFSAATRAEHAAAGHDPAEG